MFTEANSQKIMGLQYLSENCNTETLIRGFNHVCERYVICMFKLYVMCIGHMYTMGTCEAIRQFCDVSSHPWPLNGFQELQFFCQHSATSALSQWAIFLAPEFYRSLFLIDPCFAALGVKPRPCSATTETHTQLEQELL